MVSQRYGGLQPRTVGGVMTETQDRVDVLSEVLAVIDRGLGEMQHRELVSTSEVADLLLDLRLLLAAASAEIAPVGATTV